MGGSAAFGKFPQQEPDVFTAAAEGAGDVDLGFASFEGGEDGVGFGCFGSSAGCYGKSEFPHSVAALLRHGLNCATDVGQLTRHDELTLGADGAKIVGTESRTEARQAWTASAGFRRNRVPYKEWSQVSTLAVVATDHTDDVTYAVLCGACPDSDSAGEHYACYAVTYETTDIDGEPTGERLFTCKHGLGDTVEWADTYNRSFVPPAISRLTPYCPHCGTAWFACETNSRGLCVKSEVAA